jgi:hypothetical protein
VPAPYLIGAGNAAGGSTTLVVPVTTPTTAADVFTVGAVASAGTITGVTDSKGNNYTARVSDTAQTITYEFTADGSNNSGGTTALTLSDTYTVAYSSSAAVKAAGSIGCPGLSSSPVDQAVSADNAGSITPSVTTGTLAQATEACIAVVGNGNGGGAITWGGSWTPLTSQHNGTGPWLGIACQVVASTAPVTASGTITSSKWAALLVTLEVAAAGVSGAASLSGGGTLTAGATETIQATAPLTGGGTLTAGATERIQGAATLAGAGTLTAGSGSAAIQAGASLSGGGTLFAGADPAPAMYGPPTVPAFPAGYQPTQADFTGWWVTNLGFFQQKPVFRARQATAATLLPPGGTVETIAIDTVDEDPAGGWDPVGHAWTPPDGYSGWYQVTITVYIQTLASGDAVRPMLGGTWAYDLATVQGPTAHAAGAEGQFTVYLIGGHDTVQAAAALLNASTGVSTSTTAGQQSSIEILWISD